MVKKLSILFFIFSLSIVSYSQSVDSSRVRLDKLEKILAKLPRISGFVNFRYQYSDEMSTFDIRRARLDFKGDLSPVFDYRLQVEFSPNTILLDAFMRAKIKPWLYVQAGEFKIPFTIENPYSPQNMEFIDMTPAITRLCSYQDLSGVRSSGRDIGIMVGGSLFKKDDFHHLEYSVGVFNGAGLNLRDNNKSKDVIGKINFFPIKHLLFSVSGHIGEMVLDETHLYKRRDRWSGGVRYDNKKVVVRSEYIAGNTAGLRSEGGYILAGYTFFEKLTPVLRYDLFREDIRNNETLQAGYAVALNYWPFKYFRCQLNYTYRTYRNNSPADHLIGAMVTVVY